MDRHKLSVTTEFKNNKPRKTCIRNAVVSAEKGKLVGVARRTKGPGKWRLSGDRRSQGWGLLFFQTSHVGSTHTCQWITVWSHSCVLRPHHIVTNRLPSVSQSILEISYRDPAEICTSDIMPASTVFHVIKRNHQGPPSGLPGPLPSGPHHRPGPTLARAQCTLATLAASRCSWPPPTGACGSLSPESSLPWCLHGALSTSFKCLIKCHRLREAAQGCPSTWDHSPFPSLHRYLRCIFFTALIIF